MAGIIIYRLLILAVCAAGGEDAYSLFSMGTRLEFEGRYAEAIVCYRQALEQDPESPALYLALANVHFAIGQFATGIDYAQRGLVFAPDDRDLHAALASGYIARHDLTMARQTYERYLEAAPADTEAYFAVSMLWEAVDELDRAAQVLREMPSAMKTTAVYNRLGALAGRADDPRRAVGYYQQAHLLDSLDPVALLGIATGYDILGIEDSSIMYYEQCVPGDSSLDVSKRLVDLYAETDRYDKLVAMARRVLQSDYYASGIRRSLGYGLYKMGSVQAALTEFHICAGIDPQDTYARFYIGRIHLEQGRYHEARQAIEAALRADPDFTELWIYLGFIGIDTNDLETAQHAFTEAAYRGADPSQIAYLLGAIMEMQGDEESAYFNYRKALRLDPVSLPSLQALANLSERLGRSDEACALFTRIIAIDSTDATALNYVGYHYAERAESLDFALGLVERALTLDPNNGYFIDSRGWIYYQQGRYEEAVADLKRAASIVEDAVILEHLGDAYLKIGESGPARAAYEQALTLDPRSRALREKLRCVE